MWVLSKCFLQNQFLTNFDKVIAKNRFSSFSTFWNFCPYGCLQLKTIAVSSSSMDGNPLPFHWHQWLLSNHWNHWTQCIGWQPLKTIKSNAFLSRTIDNSIIPKFYHRSGLLHSKVLSAQERGQGCTAAFVHSGKTQVTLESNRSTTSSRNPGSWRPKKCFRAEWGTGGAPINSFI